MEIRVVGIVIDVFWDVRGMSGILIGGEYNND